MNKVTSTKTQLPFDYYDLPFCKNKEDHASTENLGESISGDTTTASPYRLSMKQDETCAILCKKKHEKKNSTLTLGNVTWKRLLIIIIAIMALIDMVYTKILYLPVSLKLLTVDSTQWTERMLCFREK